MPTILVVDDDALVLEALGDLLEHEGYTVLKASSGRSGVTLYRENDPDLVVSDILMPKMDGIEFIREIRRISPTQSILAISGGGRLENHGLLRTVQKLLDVATMTKPIRNREFLRSVTNALAV